MSRRSGPAVAGDLIVNYLTERRPAIDYATLTNHAHMLAALFWGDVERHHPGIASLHLPPEVATAWKTRLRTGTQEAGDPAADTSKSTGRHKVGRVLLAVRAFYLDIAQWALEEPACWGPWAAPCPIKAVEARVKYQWIAFHETIGAVLDNHTVGGRYGDPSRVYDDPAELDLRDIDPTMLLPARGTPTSTTITLLAGGRPSVSPSDHPQPTFGLVRLTACLTRRRSSSSVI